MPDVIQLLPDSVANQIAAGEVVQRPASAVKELLENAIDAKSTDVRLIIKNAGKTLIQVIDNGIGMSATDARLSLERHATSKIKKVEDLFALRTMGFRGEAVPSMAAVSQMEIKTRTKNTDLGSHLILEGSKVISQEVCQCPKGTNILIKNLFFNIPARRNFLKSNPVEIKHIIEEFNRVAMINPSVALSMTSDGNEIYRLPKGNFKQRIVNIYGAKYDQRLVPVEETTDIVAVSGFVGKPEFAKKTRGEQYFFVNDRFIKSAYLNHAIQAAFEELLPNDQFPSYFLRMEIEPSKIDINIHPTKTEIKFEEERAIYAIIRTAVRQALGKYNIAPSLDFDQEQSFDVPILKAGQEIKIPSIQVNPEFNPFESSSNKTSSSNSSYTPNYQKEKIDPNWDKVYTGNHTVQQEHTIPEQQSIVDDDEVFTKKALQLHQKYILTHIKSGFILVHQRRAHERILIDSLTAEMNSENPASQQLLFPEDLALSSEDSAIVLSLLDELNAMGFDIRSFGKNHFIIHGIPTESISQNATSLIEKLLEEFKQNLSELKNSPKENVIRSLAQSMSIARQQQMTEKEMNNLIDELFSCEMPYRLPDGKKIIISYSLDDLDQQFNKK